MLSVFQVSFLSMQSYNYPFLNSMTSTNQEKVLKFKPILKPLYPYSCSSKEYLLYLYQRKKNWCKFEFLKYCGLFFLLLLVKISLLIFFFASFSPVFTSSLSLYCNRSFNFHFTCCNRPSERKRVAFIAITWMSNNCIGSVLCVCRFDISFTYM